MDEPNVRPLDTVHPSLLRLMRRKHVFPAVETTEYETLTEDILAEAIGVAISMESHERQLDILSRIMSDKEVAVQGLQHPDMQDLGIQVALTSDERTVVLREEREPDPDDPPPPGHLGDCLICSEEAHVTLPCRCVYCLVCLREAIRVGLRSEQAFPPRCCVPLGEATIRLVRRPALVHLYRQLDKEYQVPAPNRLYCYDGRCALFIPHPEIIGCRACRRYTCRRCREKEHPGKNCGEQEEEREEVREDVWAMMDENGAVNCPGCGRMVDLIHGCNHMTCWCGRRFCYLCGGPYQGPDACRCAIHGNHQHKLRMRDRPGLKPERWRRYWRTNPNSNSLAALNTPKTIPHLRSPPGLPPFEWGISRRRMRMEWTETAGRDIPLPPEPGVNNDAPRQPQLQHQGLPLRPIEGQHEVVRAPPENENERDLPVGNNNRQHEMNRMSMERLERLRRGNRQEALDDTDRLRTERAEVGIIDNELFDYAQSDSGHEQMIWPGDIIGYSSSSSSSSGSISEEEDRRQIRRNGERSRERRQRREEHGRRRRRRRDSDVFILPDRQVMTRRPRQDQPISHYFRALQRFWRGL